MRLYQALEHLKERRFKAMEPWEPGALEQFVSHLQKAAPTCAEFSFSFLDPESADDTLQTFTDFSNELWDAGIAPIPHDSFWISWDQKVSADVVHMAAYCERNLDDKGKPASLSVRSMYETKRRDGVIFLNQHGFKAIGDHKHILVSDAQNPSTMHLTDLGFEVAAALIGALATPQAIRRDEPAPVKLNKQRLQKGREPIGPMVVIDIRASKQAAAAKRGEGSYTVRPHWRRGHIRHLADGRLIPIPPCCVNMEAGVPLKPEYVIKA